MSEVCDIFVTPDEIKRITGYKRPHEQKKWLETNGWKFELDSAGRPVIHREVMNLRFGVPCNNTNHIEETDFILDTTKIK
ncbi:DUF4224 domain-containing protein [Entomomonas asaccharolytica]|uniref:DUF4224 domain-containing protein n=1 Tax=Entomomonas asaccharolytica TaxID=2785331 RepID=A0A974RWE5_9GAMM|nr:DUF4224 domain-containing protein [Entomomonas asaccharolytica]QQP85100.1 DUF4224 domain-containing protein [Entomomonas asaccharolytica]